MKISLIIDMINPLYGEVNGIKNTYYTAVLARAGYHDSTFPFLDQGFYKNQICLL